MNISNRYFYKDLTGIRKFSDIVDISHYQPVPDDWIVIATDIRGSTQAIAKGEYKSVNMAGATTIAAIINELADIDIPFVFGGDGVTIVMPDVGINHIRGLLKFCKKKAVNASFGLDLAMACRYMRDLREDSKDIKIGKYILSISVSQAVFWGDGVDYIEEIAKHTEMEEADVPIVRGDFTGLECRWNEIPSQKDEVLSIIIKSTAKLDKSRIECYNRCLQVIEGIYGNETEYKPVR